jgi:hypothetical protein
MMNKILKGIIIFGSTYDDTKKAKDIITKWISALAVLITAVAVALEQWIGDITPILTAMDSIVLALVAFLNTILDVSKSNFTASQDDLNPALPEKELS